MSKLKRKEGVILGVCAGLAEYFDKDVVVIRVAYVLLTFFTGWLPLTVLYVILGVVLEKDTSNSYAANMGAACSSCNAPINSNAKFCTTCGNRI